MQGYETETLRQFHAHKDVSEIPAIIILDAGTIEEKSGLETAAKIRQNPAYNNTKIIVTSIFHDKELILNSGADLYLPKPYEIFTLVKWVETFIKEVNG